MTEKALKIARDIDIFDTPFIALHYHTKHKIWTGDNVLINGLKAKGYAFALPPKNSNEDCTKNKTRNTFPQIAARQWRVPIQEKRLFGMCSERRYDRQQMK
ncbi:MAG: PIN domain-containing protein [Edaphocola sp.]